MAPGAGGPGAHADPTEGACAGAPGEAAVGTDRGDRAELTRAEATELLARHHVDELDEEACASILAGMGQGARRDDPGWAEIDPEIVEEIRSGRLSEPASSGRYRAVLRIPARRRLRGVLGAWLAEQLVARGHEVTAVDGAPALLHPCPCCGLRTLDQPSSWDICTVCWWEDDTPEALADQPSPGNAGVSLQAARANVLRHGLFDPARSDLQEVAQPPERYAIGRRFGFDEDGAVVERSS